MKNKTTETMRDTLYTIIALLLFVVITILATSCTTTQDLQPTETHDVLIDKTTIKQTWAKKPETGRKFYDYDAQ